MPWPTCTKYTAAAARFNATSSADRPRPAKFTVGRVLACQVLAGNQIVRIVISSRGPVWCGGRNVAVVPVRRRRSRWASGGRCGPVVAASGWRPLAALSPGVGRAGLVSPGPGEPVTEGLLGPQGGRGAGAGRPAGREQRADHADDQPGQGEE